MKLEQLQEAQYHGNKEYLVFRFGGFDPSELSTPPYVDNHVLVIKKWSDIQWFDELGNDQEKMWWAEVAAESDKDFDEWLAQLEPDFAFDGKIDMLDTVEYVTYNYTQEDIATIASQT